MDVSLVRTRSRHGTRALGACVFKCSWQVQSKYRTDLMTAAYRILCIWVSIAGQKNIDDSLVAICSGQIKCCASILQ